MAKLQIYGSPVSSPTNKVRYAANYLNIPYDFHSINLAAGEHRKPEFLQLNPYGRIPAINDNGFNLAESNAIIRYLANKSESDIYPKDLYLRARVDQWIDYASMHVMLALSRIMFNTYFYKFAKVPKDERSLEDGRKFIEQYLPVIDIQLNQTPYLAGDFFSLGDIAMVAALDVLELSEVNIDDYTALLKWRDKIMKMPFYTQCHSNYGEAFKRIIEKINQ